MKQRAISEYGIDNSKCTVCYPFVVFSKLGNSNGVSLSGLFDTKKTNVVYSGALGDKQNPDGLLAFFQKLGEIFPDIECHIFSSGPHYERIRTICSKRSEIVKFHDLVAAEDLDELYARSDVQIIPQALGTAEGSLPSKLPNLMAAGVPVFVICEMGSELAELVTEANAGCVVYSWEIEKIVHEFSAMLGVLELEERHVCRERLRAFVEYKFSVENLVDQILEP